MVWWSKYIYLKLFHIIMRRFSGRLREVVVFVNKTIAGPGSIFRKEVWVRARFKREFIVYHFSLSMYVVPWRFLVLLTRGWKKKKQTTTTKENVTSCGTLGCLWVFTPLRNMMNAADWRVPILLESCTRLNAKYHDARRNGANFYSLAASSWFEKVPKR